MANDDGPHRSGLPVVAIATFALGTLVVVAAGLGARPVLTGARWSAPIAQATRPPQEQRATAPTTVAPQPPAAGDARHVDTTWLLVVAIVVVVAVMVLAIVWFLRNRRPARRGDIDVPGLAVEVTTDPSVEVGLRHLRRGLGRALDMLGTERDPSDAVTAAWLGLQESAEDAGFRRGAAETPTEFTTRILRQLDVDETALATLRRCYLAVRFGGVPATTADVEAVRGALQTLERQWAASPTGRP
ncbi:DUF4129 domain-containing protein [Curtobacterium sp. MCBA15_001]|uniref:DUF4129 domain-containing protein n=1 Tax=Curtobacterium sp. MCBA15_001 TaxID=1898731 RepID=UPI0008DCC744|nr:DUF4129 domain-containing protein [Curtobacterium sp. MCBA15_001]OIH95542.1 hypothetical protein BIU90_02270 [Curtobacterium sp. MCBA15_001]